MQGTLQMILNSLAITFFSDLDNLTWSVLIEYFDSIEDYVEQAREDVFRKYFGVFSFVADHKSRIFWFSVYVIVIYFLGTVLTKVREQMFLLSIGDMFLPCFSCCDPPHGSIASAYSCGGRLTLKTCPSAQDPAVYSWYLATGSYDSYIQPAFFIIPMCAFSIGAMVWCLPLTFGAFSRESEPLQSDTKAKRWVAFNALQTILSNSFLWLFLLIGEQSR